MDRKRARMQAPWGLLPVSSAAYLSGTSLLCCRASSLHSANTRFIASPRMLSASDASAADCDRTWRDAKER